MQRSSANLRFLVSPWGFDNIGEVLKKMGQGFEHEKIGWGKIKSPEAIRGCDVLFVNCAFRFGFGYGRRVAPALRNFVEQGGVLYASDWAVAGVQAAFPEMVEYDMKGDKGQIPCNVVDRGLQEIVGKQLDVHFDTSWWRMTKVNSAARVYVDAAIEKGPQQRLPIIVGFTHGAGHVLCTAFHNKAQVSEQESRLLRFLILQPVLARAAAATAQAIHEQHFEPGKEIFATVDCGKASQPFVLDADAGSGLLYYLNWTGIGTLRVTVRDPAGNIHFDRETDRPPLGCEVSRAVAGRWTCQVSGANVPYDNFPFVLTVASSQAAGRPLPPAVSTKEAATARRNAGQQSMPPVKSVGGLRIPPPPPPRSAQKPSSTPPKGDSGSRIPRPPPPRRPNR
ncbi:MAG TPA: hypothetical protein PK867_28070 [Pirellulales bacterium]|nr:hypothetical protein [Pirellulales bacterium]